MELKTNYQYTYSIYPFLIKESKYKDYIRKMVKDKKYKLKTFEKEKDFKLYQYFLPKVRELLFSSFSFGNAKNKQLDELPIDTRVAILSKYPCNIFEYDLEQDIQAKVNDKEGIYFSVRKVEVICFSTGICFLCIKTNLADESEFSDVLNFNYKFKDINFNTTNLQGYDKIKIQTDSFSNAETVRDFIENITGTNNEIEKLNIDTKRFLTYSYVCVDQSAWNNTNNFDSIQQQFIKYANNLPADNSVNFDEESMKTFSNWKYAKIALTKSSVSLFSSTYDMNNYTVLPYEYENQYFYTYIFNLYKKIYLEKMAYEYKETKDIRKIRDKLTEFTKQVWIQEVTEDSTGSKLNDELKEIFKLNELYKQVKNKYDILYKNLNIKKSVKVNFVVLIILMMSLMLNIYNFVMLYDK